MFGRLRRRGRERAIAVPGGTTPAPDVRDGTDSAERYVGAVHWIILGRAPDQAAGKVYLRNLELGQSRDRLAVTLLSSIEFHDRLSDWRLRPDERNRDARLSSALVALGSDDHFVRLCYGCLLGRDPDEVGRANHVGSLASGMARGTLVKALALSAEFAGRYREMCPAVGVLPVDVQLCELANPAKWDNPEWVALLRTIGGLSPARHAMHRKAYEFTQALYGLDRLGVLSDRARVLSVGAGHESILYALANRVGLVVATDLYAGRWQADGAAEGDPGVLARPGEYAPRPYRAERLRFLKMDGRDLAFAGGTFDAAYSLSSIEHFGGFEEARRSVREMIRVLRPGGTLALATEWRLSGPRHEEVFEPEEIRALAEVDGASLVEPIDDRVWDRYRGIPVDVEKNPFQTPHMLVEVRGTVFTSVMMFLRRT